MTVLCLPVYMLAQDEPSEFGMWTEVGAKKEITNSWGISLDGEFRTQDALNHVDRWSIALGTDYKLTKWMKVAISYTYLYSYKPAETKDHILYKSIDIGEFPMAYPHGDVFKDGYNVTSDYWTNRHRAKFDLTFDHKFFKCIKVSLRGRYQYTYRPEQRVDRMKHRYVYDRLNGEYGMKDGAIMEKEAVSDDDRKRRSDDHSLRTRLQIEYDKKKVDWTPFVSFEICNDMRDALKSEKCRTSLGCSYKVSKRHSVKAAYVYNHVFDKGSTDPKHILSLGYSFKF